MKLGVLTVVLAQMEIEKAMKYLADSGVQMVEIGCGGFPGKAHCDPEVLLNDDAKLEAFKQAIYGNGLEISALSCHGNPVHPNKEIAKKFHDDFINTILLAEKLGVDRIVGFSGCPGDCPESKYPNWVTCPWPDDFLEILDYQWNDVLIPYWKETAEFAKKHGIKKICFEMHPGFCVYNPETLLKLRAAVGDIIGANFDPSHLIWILSRQSEHWEMLFTMYMARMFVLIRQILLKTVFLTQNITVMLLTERGYSVQWDMAMT